MATEEKLAEENESAEKNSRGLLFPLVMLVTAGVAGTSVPFLLPYVEGKGSASPPGITGSAGTGAETGIEFISFGEVTVNLDEGRMNRYLRLKMSLQIEKHEKELVDARLKIQDLVLRNWLLSHLSDKTLDQIRGKAGQNMLRREIRNHFNTSLFPDGYDRIQDILFEEFNVQ